MNTLSDDRIFDALKSVDPLTARLPRGMLAFARAIEAAVLTTPVAVQAEPAMVASCCGRSECGGECGREYFGMVAADAPSDAALNDAYAEGRKDEREAMGLVVERTSGDRFENAIREFGVVNACEWFGHRADSEFTKESIRVLAERATGEAK